MIRTVLLLVRDFVALTVHPTTASQPRIFSLQTTGVLSRPEGQAAAPRRCHQNHARRARAVDRLATAPRRGPTGDARAMAPPGVRLFWRWKSRRRRRPRIPLYLQDLIADMALRPGSEWPVGRGAAERIGAAVFGGTVGARDLDRRGTPLDRQGTRPGVRPRDLDRLR